MDGEVVQSAAPSALERPAEGASSHVRRLESVLPGVFAAALFSLLGISHGGYFATAWGPLTLAFLGVAAVALVVRPRPALGLRELAVPGLLAAFALWALASSAWGVPTEAVPEAQRALAYAAGALAFALIVRRERVAGFLVGVWAGICIVCLDALAGRLFPERFGEYDPIGVYRLSEPVGYWNALGVLAALGVLLAVSLVARVDSLLVRLVAAASTVPLALTLYFTFSRGAWLALFAGSSLRWLSIHGACSFSRPLVVRPFLAGTRGLARLDLGPADRDGAHARVGVHRTGTSSRLRPRASRSSRRARRRSRRVSGHA